MRLTAEKLHRYAQKLIDQRRSDLRLLAAYLCGSLERGYPFLGGAADVDIVLIYNGAPQPEREIAPLPGDAHFDIRRHDRSRYEPPRPLRADPFMAPMLFRAVPLYDPQHFLDFVQAAVRSRFRTPEFAATRARRLLQQAREAWFALEDDLTPDALGAYLDVIYWAANTPATLLGYTLSRRRLLLDFPLAAQTWGQPALAEMLFRTIGAPAAHPERLQAALQPWEEALQAAARAESPHAELAPPRLPYYQKAVAAYLNSDVPANALYPLLYTWTLAVQTQPAASHLAAWQAFVEGLGLHHQRHDALDALLDALEEALEAWERRQGVV